MKHYIDTPAELDRELTEMAQEVARKLFISAMHATSFEFKDVVYRMTYIAVVQDFKKLIIMRVAYHDEEQNREVKKNVIGEVSNSLNEIENLRAIIRAFLMSQLGIVEAEELED